MTKALYFHHIPHYLELRWVRSVASCSPERKEKKKRLLSFMPLPPSPLFPLFHTSCLLLPWKRLDFFLKSKPRNVHNALKFFPPGQHPPHFFQPRETSWQLHVPLHSPPFLTCVGARVCQLRMGQRYTISLSATSIHPHQYVSIVMSFPPCLPIYYMPCRWPEFRSWSILEPSM